MIKDLKEVEDINLFGGKAVNLSILIKNGFNVPEGFCISVDSEVENIEDRFEKIKPVAVRSSATVEDSKNASFAGQFDTFLNINTEEELFKSIKKCIESAESDRIKAYSSKKARMAVIVQKMVDPDYSGVIFTVDPVKKEGILLETVDGLGDKLVSGEVIPNAYSIKKDLSDADPNIKSIVEVALRIEELFGCPQDIEFCVKNDEIFILQSRPITTL